MAALRIAAGQLAFFAVFALFIGAGVAVIRHGRRPECTGFLRIWMMSLGTISVIVGITILPIWVSCLLYSMGWMRGPG